MRYEVKLVVPVRVVLIAVVVVCLAALVVWIQRDNGNDAPAPPAKNFSADVTESPAPLSRSADDMAVGLEVGLDIGIQDLTSVAVGDPLTLSIPSESRVLGATVDKVFTTNAGNRVIQGRVFDPLQLNDEGPQSYPFTITTGQLFTFGTIQTSLNRYQMEVKEGVGTMVAATDLKKDIDYSKPDFVIPERAQVKQEETEE